MKNWTNWDGCAQSWRAGRKGKVRLAQRLRAETAVTLKWIAAELHMGTWTHVANRLQQAKNQTKQQGQDEFKLL